MSEGMQDRTNRDRMPERISEYPEEECHKIGQIERQASCQKPPKYLPGRMPETMSECITGSMPGKSVRISTRRFGR